MTQLLESFSGFSNDMVYCSSRPLKALVKLSSFKKNIALIKKNIEASELILVVKADAYGHGLIEIAQAAGHHSLAVAVPEELIKLRKEGLTNKVWVLEGPFTLQCLQFNLNVVWIIHSIWQVELIKKAINTGVISEIDVCIKIDTGMHRLGFVESELSLLKSLLNSTPEINIFSVMTHFAMSDAPDQQSVAHQMTVFDEIVGAQNWGGIKQTLANSGGIMNYSQSHRDWVRPGIMLYSGESTSSDYASLEPVMHFESAIIAIRSVQKGEPVGYGATWIAEQTSLIATVAVGYADGYPRHAPNGTPVAITASQSGEVQLASIVGRVSMDMITVDVTSLKNITIGDKVQLWGDIVPVGEVAQLAGTISYELLTSVSKRVPRVYVV